MIGLDSRAHITLSKPFRRQAAWPAARRDGRQGLHRGEPRDGGELQPGGFQGIRYGGRSGEHAGGHAGAVLRGARDHREVARGRQHVTSSPSTTFPSLWWRNAIPPGPTSPGASRTRSRIRPDSHPACRRAAEAQVRPRDHQRPDGVRAVHLDDHPPGGRHRAHGRRVLVLRAHPRRRSGNAGSWPSGARGAGVATRKRHRHRVRDGPSGEGSGHRHRPAPVCDQQAVTNLVKNAGEAIEARLQHTPEPPGRIAVSIVERRRTRSPST